MAESLGSSSQLTLQAGEDLGLAGALLPRLCLAAPGLPQLPQGRIPVLDT